VGEVWATPICARFEVLVDGRVGSNNPALCECLRECPTTLPENVAEAGDVALVGGSVKGEGPLRGWASFGDCDAATERAADRAAVERVGREKF